MGIIFTIYALYFERINQAIESILSTNLSRLLAAILTILSSVVLYIHKKKDDEKCKNIKNLKSSMLHLVHDFSLTISSIIQTADNILCSKDDNVLRIQQISIYGINCDKFKIDDLIGAVSEESLQNLIALHSNIAYVHGIIEKYNMLLKDFFESNEKKRHEVAVASFTMIVSALDFSEGIIKKFSEVYPNIDSDLRRISSFKITINNTALLELISQSSSRKELLSNHSKNIILIDDVTTFPKIEFLNSDLYIYYSFDKFEKYTLDMLLYDEYINIIKVKLSFYSEEFSVKMINFIMLTRNDIIFKIYRNTMFLNKKIVHEKNHDKDNDFENKADKSQDDESANTVTSN